MKTSAHDSKFMDEALCLAGKGYGMTSPNPMVGAVLVKGQHIIGRGWHRRAGLPHAEVEALQDARRRGKDPKGATLYVTLEPCCTHGRTPPCTTAIIGAGIRKVIVGATDPNPCHAGRAFKILRRAGIQVVTGVLAAECARLNEAFNHWIVHRTPFATVKAAMTLDGKIATATGESKWITGPRARAYAMRLRRGHDAVLVGINTILLDNPALIARGPGAARKTPALRRIVLDPMARTPLTAKVVSDRFAANTTIVVSNAAPERVIAALSKKVAVIVAPARKSQISNLKSQIDLRWLLKRLGKEDVTSLLVEGGGETNALFLNLAQRVLFFYAPKILGGRDSRRAVGGESIARLTDAIALRDIEWHRVGKDLLLNARICA